MQPNRDPPSHKSCAPMLQELQNSRNLLAPGAAAKDQRLDAMKAVAQNRNPVEQNRAAGPPNEHEPLPFQNTALRWRRRSRRNHSSESVGLRSYQTRHVASMLIKETLRPFAQSPVGINLRSRDIEGTFVSSEIMKSGILGPKNTFPNCDPDTVHHMIRMSFKEDLNSCRRHLRQESSHSRLPPRMKMSFGRIDDQRATHRGCKTRRQCRKSIGNSVADIGRACPAGSRTGLYLQTHLACARNGHCIKLDTRK